MGKTEEAFPVLRDAEEKWAGYNIFLRRDIEEVERSMAKE